MSCSSASGSKTFGKVDAKPKLASTSRIGYSRYGDWSQKVLFTFPLPKAKSFSFDNFGRVESHGNVVGTILILSSTQFGFFRPPPILWGAGLFCALWEERIFVPTCGFAWWGDDLLRMFMDREPCACDNFFFLNSLTIIEVLFKEKDEYRFPNFDIQVSSPAVKRCNVGMFTACLTL